MAVLGITKKQAMQQGHQLAQQGRLPEAANMFEQVLASTREGDDAFDVHSSLAMVYGQSNQFGKAVKMYKKCLTMVCKAPNVDMQACVGVRFNLGYTFQQMRR
jgi:Tfp pilus assembly protein PilF